MKLIYVVPRFATLVVAALALLPFGARAFPIYLISQPIYEYVSDLGRYVLLWDHAEIAGIEAAGARSGWHRTGYVFSGFAVNAAIVPGSRMCRFYAPSINAHFLTARSFECDGLRAHPESGWIYERNDISVYLPAAGQCETGQTPVYRLANNGPTAHRHTADPSVRAALLAQGWIDEGVAFCSGGYSTPDTEVETFRASLNALPVGRSPAECHASLASCLEVTGLAPMTTSIPRQVAPAFSVRNPDYPLAADAITGWLADAGCLHTALFPYAGVAILRSSFLQTSCLGTNPIGIHINGADSASGSASVSPMYQFATSTTPSGGVDATLTPWSDGKVHSVYLGFELGVTTLRGSAAGGAAAGAAMVRFHDMASGHDFLIAYQIYGTDVEPDSVRYDIDAHATRITTALGAAPLVGERVMGSDFVDCAASGCPHPVTSYVLRLTRDTFSSAVALARSADPLLSTDVTTYQVSGFQVRNETRLDGELGVVYGRVFLTTTARAIDRPLF